MSNFTKPIASPNNTFANLQALMKAAGYQGDRVSSLGIFNPDAAVLVYLHLTNNGAVPPVTGTDGWPIGAGAGGTGATFFSDWGANLSFLDISSAWLFSASSVNIKVMATGA